MKPTIIVVAKAPVAGYAKTRLAADVGPDAAADLAAASLLDTLDAAARWAPGDARLVVLTGDFGRAARSQEIVRKLSDWRIATQPNASFAARLVAAFQAGITIWGTRPSVLIGADSPHVTPQDLDQLAEGLRTPSSWRPTASIGSAEDGGWWGLGLSNPGAATALLNVAMSTPRTFEYTVAALATAGVDTRTGTRLRDMDTADDALRIAALAPRLRLSQAVRALPVSVR
jgi:glycosyltransferase A (GT-A) superfamily protein (DUF2064 family)